MEGYCINTIGGFKSTVQEHPGSSHQMVLQLQEVLEEGVIVLL